mmetsp:Transcript_9034/g.23621  ORF Transcript_9034/g.23621 Transcript_9034/m.23621 type:complete len:227 (+) Transcript_9034:99-779(+)
MHFDSAVSPGLSQHPSATANSESFSVAWLWGALQGAPAVAVPTRAEVPTRKAGRCSCGMDVGEDCWDADEVIEDFEAISVSRWDAIPGYSAQWDPHFSGMNGMSGMSDRSVMRELQKAPVASSRPTPPFQLQSQSVCAMKPDDYMENPWEQREEVSKTLFRAVMRDDVATVQAFVSGGLDVKKVRNSARQSMLQVATERGKTQVQAYLDTLAKDRRNPQEPPIYAL